MTQKDLNRIRIVLAEKKWRSNLLAEKLGVTKSTVSGWVNQKKQPSLETLAKIAGILDVNLRDLVISTK